MHEFQDLPIQFGQVLKAKNFNRCCILMVGLGGPTLKKKKLILDTDSLCMRAVIPSGPQALLVFKRNSNFPTSASLQLKS